MVDERGGNHRGDLPALTDPAGAPDQLDDTAAGRCIGNILKGDLGDPLGTDILRIDVFPERKRRKDADFAAGVVALDICGWVAFGIAELLRECEGVLEPHALADHLGEDEVGSAVEDTGDLVDPVGREAHMQRADDRDTAAHARLKQIVDLVFPREREQLRALLRNQLLVGGYDTLAV